MKPSRIAIVHADAAEGGGGAHPMAESAWRTVLEKWTDAAHPRGSISAPEVEHLTLTGLLAAPPFGSGARNIDLAIVSPPGGRPDTLTCRVLDLLHQANLPVILLADPACTDLRGFHAGGVAIHPLGEPASTLTGIALALAQRQTVVRALDQNLRVAHSFQGETAAEIDKLHQELLLAARVQRDFLPKHLPITDGLECSVLFRPAGFVSGDTYDVFRLDEHRVGFFLADAMGHGVPAALMTLYISGSLPRKEVTGDSYRIVPPSEALRRLNRDLYGIIEGPARFVTAVYGVVDTRTGLIDVACAGHPPPLRVSCDGVRPVDVSGMLLGVVEDSEYEQVSFRLEEGEFLIVHSDGMDTVFTPRRLAGTEKPGSTSYIPHIAAMRKADDDDLHLAMARLSDDIDGQAGSFHQDDDLTILALNTTCRRDPTARMASEAAAGA